MAVFEVVRNVLFRTSYLFMLVMKGTLHSQSNRYTTTYGCTKGKVSLERFSSFLQETELLDSFSEQKVGTLSDVQHDVDDRIGFNNAVFAWSNEAGDGTQTPSSRAFRLRVEGNLTFKRNCINLIIGPT